MKQTLSGLYKEIADKWGIKPEQVQQIEKDFWLQIRLSIAEKEGYQFLANYFGSFYIPHTRIERYKTHVIAKHDIEEITDEELNRRLKRLEECRNAVEDTSLQ